MEQMTVEPETSTAAVGSGKSLPPRREYTLEVKRRIVEETFAPGSSVSIVARRHNVNTNLLFNWRQRYRDGTLGPSKPASKTKASAGQDLIRVGVIDSGSVLRPVPLAAAFSAPLPTPDIKESREQKKINSGMEGIIEIELPNRIKLRVPAGIGEAMLRQVLAAARELA